VDTATGFDHVLPWSCEDATTMRPLPLAASDHDT
jgi:hypothetical protein